MKLKNLIPLERLHIRVPRIPNYNEEKEMEAGFKSVDRTANKYTQNVEYIQNLSKKLELVNISNSLNDNGSELNNEKIVVIF